MPKTFIGKTALQLTKQDHQVIYHTFLTKRVLPTA